MKRVSDQLARSERRTCRAFPTAADMMRRASWPSLRRFEPRTACVRRAWHEAGGASSVRYRRARSASGRATVERLVFSRTRLDLPRTVAVVGTVLQAAEWLYIAVLIVGAYTRQFLPPNRLPGEFLGEVYGMFVFSESLSTIGFLVSVDAAARKTCRER